MPQHLIFKVGAKQNTNLLNFILCKNYRIILSQIKYFFNKKSGVTLGCFLANIASTVGIVDMVVGTLATFVVALIMTKMKNFYLACLVPVVVGMVPIALEIYLLMPNPVGFLGILGELVLSEALVIYAVGVPIFYILCKNRAFTKALEFKKQIR